jgi:hypothetical protein
MTRITSVVLCVSLVLASACDSKDPVAGGREAVKEVMTQPFNALEGAKDSLKQSEDRTKAALEEFEKESTLSAATRGPPIS